MDVMDLSTKFAKLAGSLVECCQCNERFRDPRVVPCGHTLCLECLQDCAGSEPVGGNFACPKCLTKCLIPEGGLETFAKNLLMNTIGDLLESGQEPSAVQCINSEEGDPHGDPVSFCSDCVEHYCEECDRWHKKTSATRDHTLVAIEELTEEQVKDARANAFIPKCNRHKEKITLFCDNCQVAICTVCASSGHKGHEIEDLAGAAIKKKGLLGNMQGAAQEYMNQLRAMKEALLQQKANAEEDRTYAKQQINKAAAEVIKQASTQQRQFNEEIDQFYNDMASDIDSNIGHYDQQMALATKMMMVSNSLRTDYNTNVHASGMGRKLEDIQNEPLRSVEWTGEVNVAPTRTMFINELVGRVEAQKIEVPPAGPGDSEEEITTEDLPEMESAVKNIPLDCDKDVTGMTMLYGYIYLTHKKNPNLHVYNSDGVLKAQIPVPGLVGPSGLTTICPATGKIAVTCSSQSLHLLTVTRDHNIEAHDTFKLSYLPQEVTFDQINNQLLVGRVNGTIQPFELDGTPKKAIVCPDAGWAESVVGTEDGFIIADHKTHKVVKTNQAGETARIYLYQGVLRKPKPGGKTLYRSKGGRTVVGDTINNAVHLLAPTGKFLPYVLHAQHGIKSPTSIILDEVNQLLYVAQEDEEDHHILSAFSYAKMKTLMSMPVTKCTYSMKVRVNQF